MQSSRALRDKNRGIWRQLNQHRLSYVPYETYPVLGMARRLSFVNTWHLAMTLSHTVVYVVFHFFLHIAYLGITTAALIRRLRKHMTATMSTTDCATLHITMSTADLSH